MTNSQKTALTRIIVDLIKADNILDITEMDFFCKMEEKYKISEDHLVASQKIDFGTAVHVLQELSTPELYTIEKDLEELTCVDGDCAPEEAFLVMALQFCLDPERKKYSKLITTNVTNIFIEQRNIIYTETSYDEDINELLSNRNTLRYIMDDFSVIGLNFVYIPKISKDFNTMNDRYLHNVVRLLAPSLSTENQDKVFNSLRNITTKEFCEEFLIKKMDLDQIYDSEPSILLQVCKSDESISYLHIALSEDIMDDLRKLVDMYKRLTRHNVHIKTFREDNERFLYHGFHRSLFDLFAFPGKDIESSILIDLYKRKLTFIDLGESLQLSTKQLALYVFIIHQSVCTTANELTIEPKTEIKRKANQRVFSKIYGLMSDSTINDYKVGLTPALSRIKRAVSEIRFLDNVKAYIPERIDGALRVKIPPTKVFVVENGEPIPMIESDFWKNA